MPSSKYSFRRRRVANVRLAILAHHSLLLAQNVSAACDSLLSRDIAVSMVSAIIFAAQSKGASNVFSRGSISSLSTWPLCSRIRGRRKPGADAALASTNARWKMIERKHITVDETQMPLFHTRRRVDVDIAKLSIVA